MKNKTTAGLLALFLGGLGAYKFYLGQGVAGAFYLLFCWTFIPSIIAFFGLDHRFGQLLMGRSS